MSDFVSFMIASLSDLDEGDTTATDLNAKCRGINTIIRLVETENRFGKKSLALPGA